MDRKEECVCCHEIEQVANKNQEVMEYTKPTLPYDCITDNPGFHTVCLDTVDVFYRLLGWILSTSTEVQQLLSTKSLAIVRTVS